MILVAGEALVDLLVGADGEIRAVPGGGPFNVARALARLDSPVAFVGRLSSDGFGQDLCRALVDDGVTIVVDKPIDAPTTLAVARLDVAGVASYTFYLTGTSAALLSPASIPSGVLDAVTALHVGSLGLAIEPMASAVRGLVRRAGADVLVMVDVNARPAAVGNLADYRLSLLDLLSRADVVKASTEDLEVVLPHLDVAGAARSLVATGSAVLVTDGPRPIRVYGRGVEAEVPAPATAVIDTVGAGDAFGAGFLAWWHRRGADRTGLADRDLVVEAVSRAADVAAATCARRGADPPRLADLSGGW